MKTDNKNTGNYDKVLAYINKHPVTLEELESIIMILNRHYVRALAAGEAQRAVLRASN